MCKPFLTEDAQSLDTTQRVCNRGFPLCLEPDRDCGSTPARTQWKKISLCISTGRDGAYSTVPPPLPVILATDRAIEVTVSRYYTTYLFYMWSHTCGQVFKVLLLQCFCLLLYPRCVTLKSFYYHSEIIWPIISWGIKGSLESHYGTTAPANVIHN